MNNFHIVSIPWYDGIIESFDEKIILKMQSSSDGYIRPSLNAWHHFLNRSGAMLSLHGGRRKNLGKMEVQSRLRRRSFVRNVGV